MAQGKSGKAKSNQSGMYLMMCFYNTMDPYMELKGVIF
jgi:hypothetical protein